jgi:rhamnosyltransferase
VKILGHIHTFNDEDVIDQSLGALLDQTYPLDEVLIVDNASTDSTLERSFPNNVTVIRHPENRGTSGAVVTGFQYAIDKGYDWIWVFDADSAPRQDALEKLIRLYQRFAPEDQRQTRLLASLPVGPGHLGAGFFDRGVIRAVEARPGHDYFVFDVGIWSGCLFNVQAVKRIGLPNPDYVLDFGEMEYGYQGKQHGLQAFMHQSSIMDHNMRGQASMDFDTHHLGPFSFTTFKFPPIRCYYGVRNWVYFWLYEYRERNHFGAFGPWRMLIPHCRMLIGNFLLSPIKRRTELWACLRGMWDGLLKNMHHRY